MARARLRQSRATAATDNVIAFPKGKKRGAKVRRGPMAEVVSLSPSFADADLNRQWAWLERQHGKWNCEDVDGPVEAEDIMRKININRGVYMAHNKRFDDRIMREQVDTMRAAVEKRVQVKDWLETLGIDWDKAKNPEDALNFVFDRLQRVH